MENDNQEYDFFNPPQRKCECCGWQISEMEYCHNMGLCDKCYIGVQEEEYNPKY